MCLGSASSKQICNSTQIPFQFKQIHFANWTNTIISERDKSYKMHSPAIPISFCEKLAKCVQEVIPQSQCATLYNMHCHKEEYIIFLLKNHFSGTNGKSQSKKSCIFQLSITTYLNAIIEILYLSFQAISLVQILQKIQNTWRVLETL